MRCERGLVGGVLPAAPVQNDRERRVTHMRIIGLEFTPPLPRRWPGKMTSSLRRNHHPSRSRRVSSCAQFPPQDRNSWLSRHNLVRRISNQRVGGVQRHSVTRWQSEAVDRAQRPTTTLSTSQLLAARSVLRMVRLLAEGRPASWTSRRSSILHKPGSRTGILILRPTGAMPSAGHRRKRDRDGFTWGVMAVSVAMGRVGRQVTIVMIRAGQFRPRVGATC
jgi:hypothetical protein